MTEFKLGEHRVTVGEAESNYCKLRLRHTRRADEAVDEFLGRYRASFSNIRAIFDRT